jgi:drug/metabolite transporter (DMT)-like permease
MAERAADPQTAPRDTTVAGILCIIAFTLTAPVMDAFAKATPEVVPVLQIVAARFGVQVAVLVPLALVLGLGRWPSRADWGQHFARGLLLMAGTALFFTALRYMPIANALAIFFVEPFILTLLGAVLLGEEVGRRRIVACAVGFAGALLVIQPSFAELGAVALLPLGTALWAFDGSGIAALDPVRPAGLAVWTLLGVGVMATVAHLFLSFALRLAPAATIAPLQYLEIVAAAAVGYWVFGDFPDLLTWTGVAVIVTSGLYVFARERQLSLRRRPLPPT